MQTQVMHEPAIGAPWLEYYPSTAGPPRRSYLETFPFTIGRNDSTDLPIPSGRVSRQHAAIDCQDGVYRVRDLGSTNGTFLNGRRIEEAVLSDGDLIVVADVELTFFLGQAARMGNATQLLDDRPDAGDHDSPADLICQLRRLHQTLTLCSIATVFQPIVELADGRTFAYEALDDPGGPQHARAAAERRLLACECRITGRLRQLRRMVAAEQSRNLPADADLFLPVDASEMGTPGLSESLAALSEAIGGARRLVVELPQAAVCDLPHFREFCGRVRESGIAVAYDGFSAAQMRLLEPEALRPEFLKLAPSLVRNLDRNRQRQSQLRAIVRSVEELGCEIVVAGVEHEAEAEVCRELGCRFGQGAFFGPPQPIMDPVNPP